MMKNTTKNVHLTHHELLEVISIVQAVRYAATKRRNSAEVKLTNEILCELLKYDVDSKGAVVVLDNMCRYNLWNYVEQYANFCGDRNMHIEYALAVTIATKLSG